MAYLIKYEDIRAAKDESSTQFNTTAEKVTAMNEAIKGILNCQNFSGQAAACVKNYLNEVHALLLAGVSTCMSTFCQKLLLYCDGYYKIDSDQNAILPEEVLTFRITEYGKCITNLQKAETLIGGKFGAVSDIFAISNPSMQPSINAVTEIKNKIETLHNSTSQYETENKNLADLENLINSLKTSINDYANKTSSAITYKPGDITLNQDNINLLNNMINAINKSQEDASAIKVAAEHQKEIYVKMAAEERKTHGVWGVIGGAVFIVGGAICIVCTAGAATPIVIGGAVAGGGTILFGSADVISGVQDYNYGSQNDIDSWSLNKWIIEKPFQGSETAYIITKTAFCFSSSVFTGLGTASTTGTLTFRSGTVIVGKESINLGSYFGANYIGDKVGMTEGQKFVFSFFAQQLSGKGLNKLDSKLNISGTPPTVDLSNHEDHGPTPKQQMNLDYLAELGQAEIDAKVATGELPSFYKTHLDRTPTSGINLVANPNRSTTVLGRFGADTEPIINELGVPKSTDFSGRQGGFNLLNVPEELYQQTPSRPALTSQEFWEQYNKPFLDEAINRGDAIAMATRPEPSQLVDAAKGKLTGFGREYYYLKSKGYTYNPSLSIMEKVGD